MTAGAGAAGRCCGGEGRRRQAQLFCRRTGKKTPLLEASPAALLVSYKLPPHSRPLPRQGGQLHCSLPCVCFMEPGRRGKSLSHQPASTEINNEGQSLPDALQHLRSGAFLAGDHHQHLVQSFPQQRAPTPLRSHSPLYTCPILTRPCRLHILQGQRRKLGPTEQSPQQRRGRAVHPTGQAEASRAPGSTVGSAAQSNGVLLKAAQPPLQRRKGPGCGHGCLLECTHSLAAADSKLPVV